MAEHTAHLAVLALAFYAAAGAVLAAIFLAFGIERVAPPARGAYAFRPLLIPGLIALWPLVATLWALRVREGTR